MRASVRAWRFATQTAPSPVARPTGSSARPTGTVAVTTPRSGSTRVTVPLSGFATQTAPSPAATAPAPAPTSTVRSTEFVAGLIAHQPAAVADRPHAALAARDRGAWRRRA